MSNIVGIDPGKTGGIVKLDECGIISYHCIPKIGNEIDLRRLNNIFLSISKDSIVFIEKVHSIFGASAKSTFEFGRVCGLLEGMIVSHGLAYQMCDPKIWQKEMFMGITPIYKPTKGKRKRWLKLHIEDCFLILICTSQIMETKVRKFMMD